MYTGQPFRIRNIRAKRPKPGLLRQHLTAVLAAAEVSDARVEGAAPGSQTLTFEPGLPHAGDYRFAIGTAGSCTLVLQTVLPALLQVLQPSILTVNGDTHNPHAPPVDFLQQALLSLLKNMGAPIELVLKRHGFYPSGGGELVASIEPCAKLQGLELEAPGTLMYFDVNGTLHDKWSLWNDLKDKFKGLTADMLAPGTDGVRDHSVKHCQLKQAASEGTDMKDFISITYESLLATAAASGGTADYKQPLRHPGHFLPCPASCPAGDALSALKQSKHSSQSALPSPISYCQATQSFSSSRVCGTLQVLPYRVFGRNPPTRFLCSLPALLEHANPIKPPAQCR
jgi:RNA 3'-phosphate cyclase